LGKKNPEAAVGTASGVREEECLCVVGVGGWKKRVGRDGAGRRFLLSVAAGVILETGSVRTL
jgi:hypothetical protein